MADCTVMVVGNANVALACIGVAIVDVVCTCAIRALVGFKQHLSMRPRMFYMQLHAFHIFRNNYSHTIKNIRK